VANRKIILRDGAKINGDIICNSFLVNKGATGQFRISMSHHKTNIKPNREFENLKKREKGIEEKNALTGNISANKKRNEIDYHNESSDDNSNRFWD
jgi:cytoskeletal protein CcmA (bactofilin family)